MLINGHPFNGTGFGFNPGSYTAGTTPLNMPDPGFTVSGGASGYYAMSPNPIYFTATTPNYPMPGGLGGADEDYDAADLQNMALAYMPLSPTTSGGTSILTATGGMSQISILPSFHRPDLIWYYLQGQTKAPFEWQYSDLNVLRHAMLRPIGGFDFSASGGPVADHPAFTGSNPSFNPVNGPFDVDNDGDGIRESVWIDVGFPVQTAADGRTYKPLAAILCLDMDGRLNVNAHGNIADVDQYRLRSTPGTTASSAEIAMTVPPAAICNNTGATFPLVQRGEGYGPAEISLFPLFSTIGTLQAPFRAGGAIAPYTALLASRYGEANSNVYDPVLDNGVNTPSPYTTDTTAMWTASAGTKVSGRPGKTNYPDPLTALTFSMFPSTQDTAKTRTAFGSPHDVFGRGMVLCDWYGMPIRPGVGSTVTFDGVYDSPYEFNLSRKAARNTAVTGTPPAVDVTMNPNNTLNPVDRPFTPAELERILRMYDIDANDLPSRLKNLMTGTPALPLVRGLVTSDSYDLPTPPVLPTYELRELRARQTLCRRSRCTLRICCECACCRALCRPRTFRRRSARCCRRNWWPGAGWT